MFGNSCNISRARPATFGCQLANLRAHISRALAIELTLGKYDEFCVRRSEPLAHAALGNLGIDSSRVQLLVQPLDGSVTFCNQDDLLPILSLIFEPVDRGGFEALEVRDFEKAEID